MEVKIQLWNKLNSSPSYYKTECNYTKSFHPSVSVMWVWAHGFGILGMEGVGGFDLTLCIAFGIKHRKQNLGKLKRKRIKEGGIK